MQLEDCCVTTEISKMVNAFVTLRGNDRGVNKSIIMEGKGQKNIGVIYKIGMVEPARVTL